jgi:hypothetical protein
MVPAPAPAPVRALGLLLAFVVAAIVLVAGSRTARAEEALVLDNGAILRGNVVREDTKFLVFQLSGVGVDSRVNVERRRIVQRFVTVDPKEGLPGGRLVPEEKPLEAAPTEVPQDGEIVLASVPGQPPTMRPHKVAPLPDEEPTARQENFFERTSRRTVLAFPREPASRAFVVSLGLVVLLCLVGLGGRMADVEGLTLGRSTILALLLGGLVLLNVLWADTLLRADRAPVLVPLQLLAWMGCAAGILRCGFPRAFTLLGFVIFAGALVSFTAAVVLVSV